MRKKQWTRRRLKVSLKNERKVLKNKSVLLGVTGGVAAYKALDVIRRLREEGSSVTVISTEAAGHFVTPLSLEVASGTKVYTDLFSNPLSHITLPSQADIFLVAPATANSIGKFANGIADDLLSTCMLAFPGKVIIAPSMNWRMYENPVVQENLKKLASRGFIQLGPEKGSLACGEEGWGRLADVPDIIEAVKSAVTKKDLSKERIIVTAGPTREYLDPVRFLSNKSSGKMGYAIARAALRRGAEVTLISGYSSLQPPKGASLISVDTAHDMLTAVHEHLNKATVLIMAAAVSDYMPAESSGNKIEKSEDFMLRLRLTPDIVSKAAKVKNRPFIIGFAAETGRRIDNARKKLTKKNMNIIVFNDISARDSGFDVDTNKVTIIDAEGERELMVMSKDAVADALLDRMLEIKA
jgi:phosphopantothenoylcysteine decarboxylase / phosphopantothenate---cysteine ligase